MSESIITKIDEMGKAIFNQPHFLPPGKRIDDLEGSIGDLMQEMEAGQEDASKQGMFVIDIFSKGDRPGEEMIIGKELFDDLILISRVFLEIF